MEKWTFILLLAVVQCRAYDDLRVCYFTNWAQYRPDPMKFWPEDIDVNLCTHIVYAFATMEGNQLAPYEWNDESTDWSKGLYERVNDLKAQNPALKTLLAVGGWNFGTEKMTAMLATEANRAEFVNHVVFYVREQGFDGFDLDFEYPGSRGSPPEDKQRFTSLVQELRAAFEADAASTGKPKLLLTAAVAAGKDKIDLGYEIDKISPELDFISLMSYDLNGAWDPQTGVNAPLYGGATDINQYYNVAYAANYWVAGGCPADKLVIGVATYGRGFTLQDPANHGLGAPVEQGSEQGTVAGTYTRERGILAYYEICLDFFDKGAKVEWSDEHEVPYAYVGDQWIGYDDIQSLVLKIQWIKANKFAGYMVWNLDYDDFKNQFCNQGINPLLNAIKDEFLYGTGGEGGGSGTPAPPPPPPPPTTAAPPTGGEFNCEGQTDGFYPHPSDCNKYYQCAGGNTFEQSCQSGLCWNQSATTCDYCQNVQC